MATTAIGSWSPQTTPSGEGCRSMAPVYRDSSARILDVADRPGQQRVAVVAGDQRPLPRQLLVARLVAGRAGGRERGPHGGTVVAAHGVELRVGKVEQEELPGDELREV